MYSEEYEEKRRILEEKASEYIERLESFYSIIRKYPKYDCNPKYTNLGSIIGFDKSQGFINMNTFIDELSNIFLNESEENEDLAVEIRHQLRDSKTFRKNQYCEEEKLISFALEFADAYTPFCQFTFDYFKKHWEEELVNTYYIGRTWGYSSEKIERDHGFIMFSALNVIGNLLSNEEIESWRLLDIPIESMNYLIKAIVKKSNPDECINEMTVKLFQGLHGQRSPHEAYEYAYIAGKIAEYPDLAAKLEYLDGIHWKHSGLSKGNNKFYYIDKNIDFDYISSTQEYIGMISSAETLKNYFLITTSSKYKDDKNSEVLKHIYHLLMDENVPEEIGDFLLGSQETKNICNYISNPDIIKKILNEDKIEVNANNFIYRLARINGYRNPIDNHWKNSNFNYKSTECDYSFGDSISYDNDNLEQITSILMLSDSTDFELICLLMQNEYFINEKDYTRKAINTILSLDGKQKKQIYDNLLIDEKRWDFEQFNEMFDKSIYGKSKKIRGYYDLLLLKYFQTENENLNLNGVINQRMNYHFERGFIQPILDKFIMSYQVARDDEIEHTSEYKQLIDDKGWAYLSRDKDVSSYLDIQTQEMRINKRLREKYKERKQKAKKK